VLYCWFVPDDIFKSIIRYYVRMLQVALFRDYCIYYSYNRYNTYSCISGMSCFIVILLLSSFYEYGIEKVVGPPFPGDDKNYYLEIDFPQTGSHCCVPH